MWKTNGKHYRNFLESSHFPSFFFSFFFHIWIYLPFFHELYIAVPGRARVAYTPLGQYLWQFIVYYTIIFKYTLYNFIFALQSYNLSFYTILYIYISIRICAYKYSHYFIHKWRMHLCFINFDFTYLGKLLWNE